MTIYIGINIFFFVNNIMSLNLVNIGRPLCKIINGKYDGRIVSVSDHQPTAKDELDDTLIREFKSLKLANDCKLQQVPDTTRKPSEKYREILYITGASGSGKSYYTKNYIKEFQKSKDIRIFQFIYLVL
jgi:Cdc6-like AAA superfamily ATPase